MNQNYIDARKLARVKLDRRLRAGHKSFTSEEIRVVTQSTIEFLDCADVDEDRLIAELEAIFQTIVGKERELTSVDGGWEPWLSKRKGSIDWRFWERYRDYLEEKGWAPATLVRLHEATDRILHLVADPKKEGAFDRRGMVVGHVQSGKTSNYVGLICKAADAGYSVIVVLAGFHKSLRSQTQIRLEEGFLGYDYGATMVSADKARVPVGVGDPARFDQSPIADSITTRADNGDFKRAVANHFAINPGRAPLLFVIKKNGSVLENILRWVRSVARDTDESGKKYIKGVPLLVIDDEADQGSIDTKAHYFDEDGKPNDEHDPTALNRKIRQLLHLFDQSAYVGDRKSVV